MIYQYFSYNAIVLFVCFKVKYDTGFHEIKKMVYIC